MDEFTKETIKLVSIRFTLFMTYLMVGIFLVGFLHPQKMVLVAINNYGEAVIELFALLVIIPFVTLGTIWTNRDISRKLKELDQREEL